MEFTPRHLRPSFIGFILKLRVQEHLGLFMLGGPEVKPISGVIDIKYDPSP